MLAVGVILLLPGVLCAVLLVASGETGGGPFGYVMLLIVFAVVLIVGAQSRK
ncbi:hypothetical protein [Bradyrhizobium ivorense]|nr:hypothetical protein [Bradyrhizobium ivorense]MCC8940150.1 hypothetical protein [Bradyrhizobium ivorense]